jgi:predicted ATPase/DNA-binding SARP family transcriptional activator
MPLTLHLFGAPTIDLGDGSPPIALPFERRSQLVVLLALKRAWVGRAELAAMLWPDQADKLAFTNLRKTLHRLQGVAWGVPLEAEGSSLRVQAQTDVHAFEQALHDGRTADALALHRGPLLVGFDDDANEAWTSWLQFERNRLLSAWRSAALDHLNTHPDAADGPALAARLLEADPLDEAALRLHLSQLARSGQTARARQAWRSFVERLHDELGLAPGAELQALHDALGSVAAERSASLAPAAPDEAQEEGFIGRVGERRRIASLLGRDDVRLLTLTGPGGIGKTRLAQRVQQDHAAAFADGAHLVRLEDVSSEGELLARIARETGTLLRGRVPALEQLCAALRERHLLLVLDNFEQLAETAAASLEPLLAACPRLKLLVTSRVRLGLAAEHLMPLEGLPCPEREDADRIESFDAARLFIAAAQRVEPALLPAAEAAAIVDICRQLDGMPLALELAAAWTRVLSCEAIAAELREGTDLLRASDASHPARHASIEQVFDQSWRHLAPSEREALASLSVFQGGFSAEAARAVAGTPLAVLGSLADKSLLRKDGRRLLLHPLVQQLAAARLDPAARNRARDGHADYYHHLLAQLHSGAENGDRDTLQQLDVELENCRLAWQWAIVQGQAEVVRRSADVLEHHHDHRGRFEEGLALLRQALDAPTLRDATAVRAVLLGVTAHFEFRMDRYAEAEALASESLAVAGRGTERAQRRALDVLAACALRQGRLSDARRYYKQVLAGATAAKHAHNIAASLDHLALVEKRLGHYDEALRLSLESLAQHRRIGDSAGVALCLSNLGALHLAQQDAASAIPHLHEALAICERDGLTGTLAYVLSNLTEVALNAGDLAAADNYARRSLEIADAAGNRTLKSWAWSEQARIGVRRGTFDDARRALAAGLDLALALGTPGLQSVSLVAFAELLHAQGDAVGARRVLTFSVQHPAISMPDRADMRALLAQWGPPSDDDAAWPGLALDELLRRVVAETDLAHAPLRSLLNTVPAAAARAH